MESIRGFFREAAHFFAVVVRPAYRSLRKAGLAGLSVVLAFDRGSSSPTPRT
jgi:hypothetical protein